MKQLLLVNYERHLVKTCVHRVEKGSLAEKVPEAGVFCATPISAHSQRVARIACLEYLLDAQLSRV